jgi:hypothetical protein
VCVRALGGESEAGVTVDFAERSVSSSARQRAGVVRGGSRAGAEDGGRVVTCWSTLHQNLLQSQAPVPHRPVSLRCSGIVRVVGYAV